MQKPFVKIILLLQILLNCIEAFHIFGRNNKRTILTSFPAQKHELLPLPTYLTVGSTSNSNHYNSKTILYAGGAGGGKKKRRRRKKTTDEPVVTNDNKNVEASTTPAVVEVTSSMADKTENDIMDMKADDSSNTVDTTSTKTPTFKFDRDEAIALGISDADDDDEDIAMPLFEFQVAPETATTKKIDLSQGAIPLPDLKRSVSKKKVVETKKKAVTKEETKEESKRISRSDKESFKQLMEIEPQADSENAYFEEEQYGFVSALLAEGAKPFLGIPSNVLQIGHFFGALSCIIIAYIQYPGFPLTDLPTPLRDAFQGGLVTIYTINIVLAILSVFEATKRGQPQILWAIKTFTLGGLAYDQLTQLPTMEEIQRQKSIKGKRGRRRQE